MLPGNVWWALCLRIARCGIKCDKLCVDEASNEIGAEIEEGWKVHQSSIELAWREMVEAWHFRGGWLQWIGVIWKVNGRRWYVQRIYMAMTLFRQIGRRDCGMRKKRRYNEKKHRAKDTRRESRDNRNKKKVFYSACSSAFISLCLWATNTHEPYTEIPTLYFHGISSFQLIQYEQKYSFIYAILVRFGCVHHTETQRYRTKMRWLSLTFDVVRILYIHRYAHPYAKHKNKYLAPFAKNRTVQKHFRFHLWRTAHAATI